METITANCPNCKTQYQLTEEQLAVAGGQVRCGSCMTVFQARPVASSAAPAVAENEDDLLYGDDGGTDSGEPRGADNFSDSFKNIQQDGDSFGSLMDSSDAVEQINTAAVEMDEAWAEQLLHDEDDGLIEKFDDQAVTSHTSALGADADDFDDLGLDESLQLSQPSGDDVEQELSFNDVSNPFGGDDKEGILKRITPEPLEFHVGHRVQWWSKLIYAVLSIIALLAVVAQYLYFELDELARQQSWRPAYTVICNVAGCQLPSLYNVEEITAKHLTVKSHPYYKGVLVVDTVITNHAAIAQPFPQLELYFTDTNDKIVAARRFQPGEYLRGELASRTLMPSRQPVHLAIEIADPGKSASGYWIKLSYGEDAP